MVTLTEWTAIALLSLGVIKMVVGLISPSLLLDYKKNPFSKLYMDSKQWRIGILLVLALFMVYVSFMSNISLAQWFIAGYTMLIIATSFLFFSDKIMKTVMGWFGKISENNFRLFAFGMLILELIALYFIVSNV